MPESSLTFSLFTSEQREAEHIEHLRNTKTSCMRRCTHHLPSSLAGPSCRQPWTDSEIRIFMQEWKVVEWITGHPGRKIYQKSWALYQRLNGHRGLKKSWESCVDLLLTLQNLHRRLCNVRGDTIPLFSPYSEDLYSILIEHPSSPLSFSLQDKTHASPKNMKIYIYILYITPACLAGLTQLSPKTLHPWPDYEIRIFMQEWQVVERITGHPGREICQKSWALYQRLNGYWDLKSWESCVDLLLTLQNRHSRLCNGRGDTISLFSPYSEDLSSILGHSPWTGLGNHGIPGPSRQFQRNPLLVRAQGDCPFLRWETQKHCCPSSAPHLLPACDPGLWGLSTRSHGQPLINTQILNKDYWSFVSLKTSGPCSIVSLGFFVYLIRDENV
uniref:Uncharacterized protein n=1 Tax=Peromyscus maniculatus bairdii TaxID=230844 RepID=A0A8C8UK88_PERMB